MKGLTGTALLLLLLAADPAVAQQKASQSSASSTPRYQLYFSPHGREDTFLVDLFTGKVWILTTFTDMENAQVAWKFMERLDDDKALDAFLKKHKLVPPPDEAASE